MVEWSILALVVLGFAGLFGHYTQRVHSQAERAAVLTTLGALRTALVLEQLHPTVRTVTTSIANPLDALAQYPATYAGTVTGRDVAAVAPGQWVFDDDCACIGYKPTYLDWLQSNQQLQALWFQRRGRGSATLLVPLDRYVWDGLLVE